MNSEWSLDVLYKGFDDPKFSEDLTSFEKKAKELDEISKTLSHENEKEDLIRIVKALEEFELFLLLKDCATLEICVLLFQDRSIKWLED